MLTLTVHELVYALRDVDSTWRVEAWVGDEATPDVRAVSNPQAADGRVILWCGPDEAILSDVDRITAEALALSTPPEKIDEVIAIHQERLDDLERSRAGIQRAINMRRRSVELLKARQS